MSDKPSINIAGVGQQDHGCTMLAWALAHVLAKHYGTLATGGTGVETTETKGSTSARVLRLAYATATYNYVHADFPTFQDAVKALESGIATVHAAIVVVSATEGPTQQTRDLVATLRKAGVQRVLIFVSQTDRSSDAEMLDLFEMQTRDLLSEHGYPGDDLPAVRGSALQARQGDASGESTLLRLAQHLDTFIPSA